VAEKLQRVELLHLAGGSWEVPPAVSGTPD
jgi:hypothetical protein